MTSVQDCSGVVSRVDADADGGSGSDDGVGPQHVLCADGLVRRLARRQSRSECAEEVVNVFLRLLRVYLRGSG